MGRIVRGLLTCFVLLFILTAATKDLAVLMEVKLSETAKWNQPNDCPMASPMGLLELRVSRKPTPKAIAVRGGKYIIQGINKPVRIFIPCGFYAS